MNALPDYIVIDFFNWIKANESSSLNIGYVRECVLRDRHTYSAMKDLTSYAKKFIIQKDLDIEPYELTESIRIYLTYRYADENSTKRVEKSLWDEPVRKRKNSNIRVNSSEDMLFSMQVAIPTALHIEIEFLEWLLKQKLNADDISKMPICVFEKLAEEFSIEIKGKVDNNLLSALRNDFKRNSVKNFLEKLKRLIFLDTFGRNTKKYKSIIELFCRYSNPNIIKCFFLPLSQDKMFETFINNSWNDLNSLSKDYLDIYYSIRELSASGYDIKDKFHSLEIAEDALPCLVLWSDSIDNAKYIELRDLQYTEIFHLLQAIVQNIKVGNKFDVVYSKAVLMADEKRRNHNGKSVPIMNQNNYSINNSYLVGSQIGTTNSKLNFNQNGFSGEINQAISEIKTIAELSEKNKSIIIDLLKQIDAAVQADNKDAQTEAKFTLKGVLKGIGNASVTVISILSGLANLAKFFGFPAP